jgi:hypothetical protein
MVQVTEHSLCASSSSSSSSSHKNKTKINEGSYGITRDGHSNALTEMQLDAVRRIMLAA